MLSQDQHANTPPLSRQKIVVEARRAIGSSGVISESTERLEGAACVRADLGSWGLLRVLRENPKGWGGL